MKTGNENFDVSMGCFNGVEKWKLVGSYILSKLKIMIKREGVGLYRDNGLGVFCILSGPQVDRKRNQVVDLFKQSKLSITAETNLKTV